MKIIATTNAPQVARALRENAKQARFALKNAINATAKDVQAAQVAHESRAFTVRRPDFINRSVKIKPFASLSSLSATIKIDPPGGQARASILTQHEEGGAKKPLGRSLAIPGGARTNKAGIVTKGNRPRALNFKAHGGKLVMRGDKRTVLIRNATGKGMIFRRKGKGKRSQLVPLFNLVPQGKLAKRLHFKENATRVVHAKFRARFDAEFRKALASARA